MHIKVHYVTSLVLVLIFSDVILVTRGQLPPNLQDGAARNGGIPDSAGPPNGAGPPLDPSTGSNQHIGGNIPPRQANTHLTVPICREGWIEAKLNKVPICVYLNKNPLTWEDARDSCRKDFGFLLKLEAPVSIGPQSLQQYLVNNHTQAIWTGLHEENDHLMWDEFTPHLVRHYNDYLESQQIPNRIWDWDIDDVETDTENCGELEISDLWQITSGDSRRKRSPEDENDQTFPSNSKENDRHTATNPLGSFFASQNSDGSTQLNKRLLQNTQMRNVQRTVTTITRRQHSPNVMQVSSNNEGIQGFRPLQNVPTQQQEDSQDIFPMIPRLDHPSIRPAGIEQWNNRLRMRNKKVTLRAQTQFTSEEQAYLNSLGGLNFEASNQPSSTPLQQDVGVENEDDDSETRSTVTPPSVMDIETESNTNSDQEGRESSDTKLKAFTTEKSDNSDSDDRTKVDKESSFNVPNTVSAHTVNVNPTPIANANQAPIANVNQAPIANANQAPIANADQASVANQNPIPVVASLDPTPITSINKEIKKDQDDDDDKTAEKQDNKQRNILPPPHVPIPQMPKLESPNTDDSTEITENIDLVQGPVGKAKDDDSNKEDDKKSEEDYASAIKAVLPISSEIDNVNTQTVGDETEKESSNPDTSIPEAQTDDKSETVEQRKMTDDDNTPEIVSPVNSIFGSLFTNDDSSNDNDAISTDMSGDNSNIADAVNDVVEDIIENRPDSTVINTEDTTGNVADVLSEVLETIDDNQDTSSEHVENISFDAENENSPDDQQSHTGTSTDDQTDNGLPGVSFIGQGANQRPPPPPIFVGGDDTTNPDDQLDNFSDIVEEIAESSEENDTNDKTINTENSQENDVLEDFGNDADVFDLETDNIPSVNSDLNEEDAGDGEIDNSNVDNFTENEDHVNRDNETEDNELPKEAASNGGEERIPDFGDQLDELDELPTGIAFDPAVLRQDIPPQDIVQHIPQSTNDNFSEMFARRKAKMKLTSCKNKRPSMCFSHPLTLEKKATPCGDGWYGNLFIDKCYKAVFPALTFDAAMEQCRLDGGTLANIESELEEKLVIMMIAKSQNELYRPGRVKPVVWVNSEPIWKDRDRMCFILSPYGSSMRQCNMPLEAVCEKLAAKMAPRQDVNAQNHDMTPQQVQMSVDNEDNSLDCDARSEFPELPTLWFKDGVLVDIKIQRRSESILPSSGSAGRQHSPLPSPVLSPTTSIFLNSILRETLKYLSSRQISPAVLQGKYWCEAWSLKPFTRRKSKPFIVTFSDVISFLGSMQLPHATIPDALLYNTINKAFTRVQNAESDLSFVMDSASSSLQSNIPAIQSITSHDHHITRTKPLRLEYYTYLKMSKNYTMANEGIAYILLRRNLREVMSNISYILSLSKKTPPYAIRSIDLTSTVACPTVKLRDKQSGLMAMFRRSATHTNVESEELCEGERAGSASCNGDFFTGAYWDKIVVKKLCHNHTSIKNVEKDDDEEEDEQNGEYGKVMEKMSSEQRLKELAESKVEDEDVETVIEETAVITEETKELTATDVDYIAEIMEKTETVKKVTKEISKNILKTVDKVMAMDEKEIKKANKEKSAANRIIKRFEKIAETSEVEDDGKLKIVEENVAMEIWRLDLQKNPIIGMAAKQYKEERLVDRFRDKDIITIYNESQLYDNVEAAIELPPELIQEAMTEKGKATRLVMVVYRDGRLFKAAEISDVEDETHNEELGKLNSFVISASLGGKKIQGLTNKVKTVFRPLERSTDTSSVCVYWDFNMNDYRGGWSTDGCVYDGIVNGHDICLCDHLTNFAVLMDFHGQGTPISRDHVESLSIISLIGLSLSILGLSLTIISYVFFKKLRHGRAQQTLFNLALSMLCSWVVFLVGIKQTHSQYGCLIVAVLLHYFILSSFMWMLMEAFLQYLTFVKVLGTYVTRYALKTVIIAWGLPVIPVVTVLSIDYDLYNGGSDYCWMKVEAFYWAFALPVGLICLCNLTVFVVTIISICRRPSGLRSNQSKQKMVIANLQAAITSFILLGLTWILGYLSVLPHARLVFQYAFTILNSLQGFFIFVLFVARKKRVRDQWMMICCCKTPTQEKATRSLSASASIPSSCSGRSSYSGRTERSDSTQTTTSFVNQEYQSIYAIPIKKRCSRESLYYRKP